MKKGVTDVVAQRGTKVMEGEKKVVHLKIKDCFGPGFLLQVPIYELLDY